LIEIVWMLLALSAFGVVLGTLAGFLGRLWWVFDLFSHFRVQYLVLLAAFALLFLAGGRLVEASLCALFALLNLALILPLYSKAPPASPNPGHTSHNLNRSHGPVDTARRPVKVLLANVLQRNREFVRVRDLIREEDPDLFLLIEINRAWVDELQPVLSAYPHRLTPLREDNYGLGLFSKLPFVSAGPVEFGTANVPSILAHFEIGGQPLAVIGTHPPPPKRAWLAAQRDAQLQDIAGYVASHPGATLVMGDLNITSWSPHFQELLRLGRLQDSRQGQGLHPSWPVDRPLLRVPIDHILVTDGLAVHRRRLGPFTGSDHYPVLMEFSLCPPPSTK
jgi:endonuclease/exonuclease/phosphatase (EEP) superfamily protein YafD